MSEAFSMLRLLTQARNEGTIVWLCNIGAEQYWHPQSRGIPDREEDRIVNRIEEMNLLLCRPQDVLILREQPDPAFLAELRRLGFDIPAILTVAAPDYQTPISELVLKDEGLLQQLKEKVQEIGQVYFMPYAVTMLEEEIAQICGLSLIGPSSETAAIVNDKILNRQMAEELQFPVSAGIVSDSLEELKKNYPSLKGASGKMILKEPYAASGKGLYIIESDEQCNALFARLSRLAARRPKHPWMLEQWVDKSADVNVQLFVQTDGTVDVFSIKRQVLNGTVYIGSQMPAVLDSEVIESFQAYGEAIGRYLHKLGYHGVAGIDSMISKDGVIIPIIEVNGRFTLSTYLSFIPHVLGNKKMFSRYFRVLTNEPVFYADLCKQLESEQLLYQPESGQGVILYTSGTLPNVSISGDERYMGRVFALIAADDWTEVERLSALLEQSINKLTDRMAVSR
ncbi:peptide ligase PGM1-related protein [Paenibacillus sp. MMS18-CY102]|uniref:preATP grasp domain-containing protein n=1 Tax=Paenibacillus sp. MMS18-CY102 TaxID=2682849 RepID=UPI0013661978|nr:peptide ligase PGM1-related protein [Paenibacillus sp. MMS18-CY102]MWC28057.1 ATP-grasp domain-containing protein [Paenibacillus sp. MMS18-CY102]